MTKHDPFDSPEWKDYKKRIQTDLLPKLEASAMTVTLAPTDPATTDIKFAVELGLSIMLNKPIIVVIDEAGVVPPGLEKIADAIIRGDLAADSTREALGEAISQVAENRGLS